MLRDVYVASLVRRLAGGRSFVRGVVYEMEGRVRIVEAGDDAVLAEVRGTSTYGVRVAVDAGEPDFACTCPMGEMGHFCKHCVAVVLALDGARPPAGSSVRDYLETLDRDRLIELLLEQVGRDPRLGDRLRLRAATSSQDLDRASLRAGIDVAFDTGGFVSYRELYDWAQGPRQVVDLLGEALDAGLGSEVVELVEHALAAWEEAIESVDDSDGYLGTIRDDLYDLHLRACEVARPDPDGLAERLFRWAMQSNWETFLDAASTHAGVLGEAGLARYRALTDELWLDLPELRSGDERTYGWCAAAIVGSGPSRCMTAGM